MTSRAQLIQSLLTAVGWQDAVQEPLAAEASARQYSRLRKPDGRTAILMSSNKPELEVIPFVRMDKLLQSMDVSAPQIYGEEAANGLLLLEDFGNDTFLSLFKAGYDHKKLLMLLADTLAHLRKNYALKKPDMTGFRNLYGPDLYRQIELIPTIYLPAQCNTILSESEKASYIALWQKALAPLQHLPQTIVLRDCNPANLMHLPHKQGIHACGLIDFETGGLGPSVYDLMSCLRSSRYAQSDELAQEICSYYLSHFPEDDVDLFYSGYYGLGALRAIGWAGTCARLIHNEGRSEFAQRLPEIWSRACGCLQHPSLTELRHWHEQYIPEARQA
jgi:aminoglycoside/choline kinase family phosphotransferase